MRRHVTQLFDTTWFAFVCCAGVCLWRKQSVAEELDDFLGESSDAASDDEAGRNRQKIARAINPVAMANAAARGEIGYTDK